MSPIFVTIFYFLLLGRFCFALRVYRLFTSNMWSPMSVNTHAKTLTPRKGVSPPSEGDESCFLSGVFWLPSSSSPCCSTSLNLPLASHRLFKIPPCLEQPLHFENASLENWKTLIRAMNLEYSLQGSAGAESPNSDPTTPSSTSPCFVILEPECSHGSVSPTI